MANYTPKALAEVITQMNYGTLLEVADALHDMNAGENEGLRDMTNKYGLAGTLFDWAEATIEEANLGEENARKARLATTKAA
jgi:hypothetical protein